MQPIELRDLDAEVIRVPLERGMVRLLRTRFGDGWRASAPSYERASATLEVEAELRALTLDPRVLRAAEEARRVLGIDRAVEVHASHDSTACAHYADGGPLLVSVHWNELADLDDAALIAVLGHELGHHQTRALSGPDPVFVRRLLGDERLAGMRAIAGAACRARELTADRYALLACQDIDAVLGLFAGWSDRDEERRMDPHAYLETSSQRAEALLARRERAAGDTHPESAARAYALWLFSQTETYFRLTGQGDGSRHLIDVNGVVARLVGPWDEAAPDEPCWFDDVGQKIDAGSAKIGKLLGAQASRLSALISPEGPEPRAAAGGHSPLADEERDRGEGDLDDLERRFRELERRMGAG